MQQHKMQMGKKQFRIADIAELLDVKKNILRAWEDGFNIQAYRSDGGGRLYSLQDVEIFSLIKKQLQHHKASIEEVKRTLEERFGSAKEKTVVAEPIVQKDVACEPAQEGAGEMIGESEEVIEEAAQEVAEEGVVESEPELVCETAQEATLEIVQETKQETHDVKTLSCTQEANIQGAVREENPREQESVSPAQMCKAAGAQEDETDIFEFEIRDEKLDNKPALVIDNVAYADREAAGIKPVVSTSCFCSNKQKEILEFKTQLLAFRDLLRKA